MERQWPSTQQMLLDHLRRIVEGVDCVTWGDPPNERWYFGGGHDCLVSCVDEENDHQASEGIVSSAKIEMFLSLLAVEARGHCHVKCSNLDLDSGVAFWDGHHLLQTSPLSTGNH